MSIKGPSKAASSSKNDDILVSYKAQRSMTPTILVDNFKNTNLQIDG